MRHWHARAHQTRLRITIALAGLALLASGCSAGEPLVTATPPVAANRETPTMPPAPTSTPITSAEEIRQVAAAVTASRAPEVGQPAPNFTLTDLDGRAVQLADFRGRPVLLNFFASWCGPCAKELPVMRAAQDRFKDQGLQLVLVNLQEDPAAVRGFVERLGLAGVPVLIDERGAVTAGTYWVPTIPSTFFIDANGVIQAKGVGELDAAGLQRGLARIVAVEGMSPTDAPPTEQPQPGAGCELDGC